MRDLWRIAAWGLSATAALTLVAYAGTTEPGRDRLHVAVAEQILDNSLISAGLLEDATPMVARTPPGVAWESFRAADCAVCARVM